MNDFWNTLPARFGSLPPQSLWADIIEATAADRSHYATTISPTAQQCTLANATCGDELTLLFTPTGKDSYHVTWRGHGCILARAGAAALTELLDYQPQAVAQQLVHHYAQLYLTATPAYAKLYPQLGGLALLAATVKFPVRIKCVLLATKTAQALLTPPPVKQAQSLNLNVKPLAEIEVNQTNLKEEPTDD